jgi:hypothetical protein
MEKITQMPPSPGEIDGVAISPCVRSGFCCNKFTCNLGVLHGSKVSGGCDFLRGNEAGAYSCGLVDDETIKGEQIHAGAGCCAPMFNTEREKVIRAFTRQEAT